ncbi:MAG: nitronate monooxygenase family protein [bacterium]|nr:nitronate monooxygenase family protein [bacterium]
MNNQPLYIGEKKAKVPMMQGSMGIGISLGGLAGAVAKAGGVGMISTAQIGFRDKDFERNPFLANLKAMRQELKKARQIAPDGIIGFNIMTALTHYKDYAEYASRLGADLIVSGAGLPVDLPRYVNGTKTAIAPIVSSKKSAHTIFHYWQKKFHRLPDLLVVEGPQAGGHLGFTRETLLDYEENSEQYIGEIKEIFAEVKWWEEQYKKKIPVVVAGGVDTKEKVKTLFQLGADGVQVGSRFVTTVECDAAEAYKQQYLSAEKEDIVVIQSPVGMPGRAIRNTWLRQLEEGKKDTITKCYHCLKKCEPAKIPYCITKALIAAANGDMENGLVFCGANAYKSKKIETVSEVIDSLLK